MEKGKGYSEKDKKSNFKVNDMSRKKEVGSSKDMGKSHKGSEDYGKKK